tara:strand:- start:628 stop:1386 length:759 start_codon:yes stop_codon:yes gene_type:complete
MKNKNKNNEYFIYGMNNSKNILASDSVEIVKVTILKNSIAFNDSEINQILSDSKIKYKIVDKYEFDKRFKSYSKNRTQGIVIDFKYNFDLSLPSFESKNSCLILPERIEDPQNLGQIIRTSECAGVDGILLSSNKTAKISNVVLQVSQGAFLKMPIYKIGNICQTINNLKKDGFWIIGIENSIDAKNWFDIDMLGKVVLVFGSEGNGIRKSTLDNCDFKCTIPMSGVTNSLNISACVSSILFERKRQILNKK